MSTLYKFLEVPGLSKSSRRILEASIYATILGKAYIIDDIGLDLQAVVADDTDLVGAYITALGKAVKGFEAKTPLVAAITPLSLYKYAHDVGSFMYRTDIHLVKPVAKSMARRAALVSLYKKSGPPWGVAGREHEHIKVVRKEDGARTPFMIESPAVTNLVTSSYNDIATVMRKEGGDSFFDRYIFALERIPNFIVSHENFTVALPDFTLTTRLTAAMTIARTLEEAGRHIDVAWSFSGRKLFEESLDERWSVPELRMSLDVYIKIKKLAALFAVARNLYEPCISQQDVEDAISYLDVEHQIKRLDSASVDMREQRRDAFMKKLQENIEQPYEVNTSRNSKPFLHELGMVTSAHMLIVCGGLKCFSGDPILNKKQALNQTVRDLSNLGLIEVLPDDHRLARCGGGEEGKGRIFSDIIYLTGSHLERVDEWK